MHDSLLASPDFEDELTRPYWEGFEEHEIRLPTCSACGERHWYPSPRCPHCQSPDVQWRPVSGTVTVFTWVEVHYDFDLPYLEGKTPRYTALVTPIEDDDLRLPAILAADKEPTVGDELEPVFRETDDGTVYPVYEPV